MPKLKLKNTLIYTFLGFLPLSFSVLFTPLYTQYLSKADYGLLNLFNIISGILVSFFGLGIDQAAGFLYWDYSKIKKNMNEFMSTTLYLIFFIAIILFSIGFIFGPWFLTTFVKDGSHFSKWPFITLALVYPFFVITNRVLLYYYRNEGNIKKYAALNISALVFITAGSIMGVILFKMGAGGAVEGRTVGFCVVVLFFLLYEFGKIKTKFNKTIAFLLLRMGGPLFFSTLIGSLAYVGDRLIVEQTGTLEMLGVYGFSVTIASVVEILMGALGNSFNPGIYRVMLEEDESMYENMRFQIFIYVYSLIAAVVIIIAIITPFIKLFISDNFVESIKYIPLLCLSFIPRIFTQLYSLKFYKRKKTIYILWLNLAYFLSVLVFGTIFYKYLGLTGISLSVFITGLINMYTAYLLSRKLDSFSFHFNRLFLLFIFVALTTVGISLLPFNQNSTYFWNLIPFVAFLFASTLFLKGECLQIKTYLLNSFYRLIKQKNNN